MSSIIENKDGKRVFVRFTLSQRIEHVIQIVSFIHTIRFRLQSNSFISNGLEGLNNHCRIHK